MADLTQAELEEWIKVQATGKFHYTKVMDGQVKPDLYPQLRSMMHRCKDRGVAFPVDGKDGWWRPADNAIEEICWWNSSDEMGENILLPLGLNKYCYIPLPSLIIVAGKYNAGKTALLINIITLFILFLLYLLYTQSISLSTYFLNYVIEINPILYFE